MKKEELKPCPFCGAHLYKMDYVKVFYIRHKEWCYLEGMDTIIEIDQWNRRTP
jgi:hypothetical protein